MSVSKNILLFLSFAFLTTAYICAFSEDPTRPVESALFYTSLIFILVALLILATVLPSVSEEAVTKCIHLRNGQSVYVWTLIVAGIIMRVAGLDRIPPGLWYDEANHGLDAIALLEGFTLPVYFISNCGQEPIFKYLIAGSICLFSNTVYALRLIPALSGLMTVLLIYFMLKSAFSRTTAVLTTGFFVFNPWHFHFSRIAFRSILVPVWIALTVILIQYRGRFSGKRYHLLLGIISGLGLYTYYLPP